MAYYVAYYVTYNIAYKTRGHHIPHTLLPLPFALNNSDVTLKAQLSQLARLTCQALCLSVKAIVGKYKILGSSLNVGLGHCYISYTIEHTI